MLLGEKVKLRRIGKADLPRLWKWHETSELHIFKRPNYQISYDELNECFYEYLGNSKDFLVEAGEITPVGICSYKNILWKNRSCELSYTMNEKDPKQLFALDALAIMIHFLFNELNIARIQAVLPEFAAPEIFAFEKSGFIREGRLREHFYKDGGFKDVYVYVLFKNGFFTS